MIVFVCFYHRLLKRHFKGVIFFSEALSSLLVYSENMQCFLDDYDIHVISYRQLMNCMFYGVGVKVSVGVYIILHSVSVYVFACLWLLRS